MIFYLPWRNSPPVGQGLLIIEASRSHSDTPQSVGLLWTGDQPDADLYLITHNTHNRQTSIPSAGFEPAVPASERPQIHALYRAAAGTGNNELLENRGLLLQPDYRRQSAVLATISILM
jgi:hypothetical protein